NNAPRQEFVPTYWRPLMTAVATTGVILGAIYMLWMFQRVMQGPLDKPENQSLRDLNGRERCVLIPIVIAMFAIGIFPSFFLQTLAGAASKIVVRVGAPAPGFETSAGVGGRGLEVGKGQTQTTIASIRPHQPPTPIPQPLSGGASDAR